MGSAPVTPATPVLIPGNMCDARLWTADVRAALPGCIDADTTNDATIAAMARRTLAATEGPLIPIGFSMGAIVALEMARQAPWRIAGLALLDANASADLPERAAARLGHQAQVRAGGLAEVVQKLLMPSYLAAANSGSAELQALILDMALTLGSEVFVAQSEALRTRDDLRPVLSMLNVPVLIACGAEDRLCPPDWHRNWAASVRHPSLHIVENAGHMLPLEQPAALAAILQHWFGENFGARA